MTSISKPDTSPVDAQRMAYVEGLRELADFIEANPQIQRYGGEYFCTTFGSSELGLMGQTAKDLGGGWEKESDGMGALRLIRKFGPHRFALVIFDVCEKVVVGTETVTREVPDPAALAAVPTVTVTETVEKTEWKCPPSVMAEAKS